MGQGTDRNLAPMISPSDSRIMKGRHTTASRLVGLVHQIEVVVSSSGFRAHADWPEK